MDDETYRTMSLYVDSNPIATIGTINADGSPYGAVVYICADDHRPILYFLTKIDTKKYQNLRDRRNVSITIVNPPENSTLQASGRAFDVEDPSTIDVVMAKIAREHVSATEWLPPIAKIRAGAYAVVGVEMSYARLAQFKGMSIGDERIFIGGAVA